MTTKNKEEKPFWIKMFKKYIPRSIFLGICLITAIKGSEGTTLIMCCIILYWFSNIIMENVDIRISPIKESIHECNKKLEDLEFQIGKLRYNVKIIKDHLKGTDNRGLLKGYFPRDE